jgi:hypothetical protein
MLRIKRSVGAAFSQQHFNTTIIDSVALAGEAGTKRKRDEMAALEEGMASAAEASTAAEAPLGTRVPGFVSAGVIQNDPDQKRKEEEGESVCGTWGGGGGRGEGLLHWVWMGWSPCMRVCIAMCAAGSELRFNNALFSFALQLRLLLSSTQRTLSWAMLMTTRMGVLRVTPRQWRWSRRKCPMRCLAALQTSLRSRKLTQNDGVTSSAARPMIDVGAACTRVT